MGLQGWRGNVQGRFVDSRVVNFWMESFDCVKTPCSLLVDCLDFGSHQSCADVLGAGKLPEWMTAAYSCRIQLATVLSSPWFLATQCQQNRGPRDTSKRVRAAHSSSWQGQLFQAPDMVSGNYIKCSILSYQCDNCYVSNWRQPQPTDS